MQVAVLMGRLDRFITYTRWRNIQAVFQKETDACRKDSDPVATLAGVDMNLEESNEYSKHFLSRSDDPGWDRKVPLLRLRHLFSTTTFCL